MGTNTSDVKFRLAMEGAAVVQSDLKRVEESFAHVKEGFASLKEAAEALGVMWAVDKVLEHTKAIIESGDAMDKMSQRTGIAVQDLAKYQLATAQVDITMESLSKGVKGVSVNLLEHGEALRQAGLKATTADAAMIELADVFKAMPDGMEKTSLAVKLFGKSGMELIPMLNMGSEGLKDAADKSSKFAATMQLLAPQSSKFNENMAEIAMYSKITGMSIMKDMLPGLIATTKAMADAAREGGTLKGILAGIGELAWESWGRSFEIWADKLYVGIQELEARKKRWMGDDQAADAAMNLANERKLRIQALVAGQPKAQTSSEKKLTTAEEDKLVADAAALGKRLRDALGGSGGTAAASEYDNLIKKLGTDVAKASADAEAAQNGYNKAQTEFVALTRTDVWAKMSISQKVHVAALYEAKITSEKLTDATKLLNKADLDAAIARDKFNVSLADGLVKMQADVQAQQDSNDRLGLSKDAVAALDSAKLQAQANTLDGLAIKTRDGNLDENQYNLYKAQAQALRDLAQAKVVGAAKETAIDAAKASAEEWKKGWEETDKLARHVFVTWGEDGSNAAKKIGDTLKKALLSAIYEAELKPIALAIYSSVAGSAASAATGATGSAMGSGIGSMIGSATGLGGVGSSFAAGWSAAAGMPVAAALPSAGITGAAAEAGSGAYAMMASVPVYGWIALAAVAAYEVFHKNFISATSTGTSSSSYNAGGAATSRTDLDNGAALSLLTNNAATKVVDSMETGYLNAAKTLGISALATQFTFASNTGREGANPNFTVSGTAGNSSYVSTTGDPGLYAPHEVAMSSANMQLEASRVIFSALQASTLPKYLAGVFDGLSASAMTQQQLNDSLALAQSYSDLHAQLLALPFANLKDLSYAAASGLMAAAGGMQAFSTNLATYYKAFYTADEQRAQNIKNVNATLAAAGITAFDAATETRDQFRALVDAQDVTTASGQKAYAALLSVAGALDQLTPASTAGTDAVKAFSTSISDLVKNLASERANIASAVKSMGPTPNLGPDQLSAAIAANRVSLPDGAGVVAASTADFYATAAKKAAAAAADTAQAALVSAMKANPTGMTFSDPLVLKAMAAGSALGIANLAAADAQAKLQAATASYATALQQYSTDATNAVKTYTDLRTQVVAYYDAQKAASAAMLTSASNLRAASDLMLSGGLTDAQSLAQMRGEFSKNYSLALSTSGSVQAGYADKLTAALPALSTAIMNSSGTREQWLSQIAQLAGQSNTIAGKLDAGATVDYTTQSLALLGQIDTALGGMQSDAAIISKAVTDSSAQAYLGMQAIVDAIYSTSTAGASTAPAIHTVSIAALGHAGGGMHAGGLRIVGEETPELEATGPSRIWNAPQIASALRGGDEELRALVKKLTEEVQGLRFETRAVAGHTQQGSKILKRVCPDGSTLAISGSLDGGVIA